LAGCFPAVVAFLSHFFEPVCNSLGLLTAMDIVSAVSALPLLDATFFIESSGLRWMLEEKDFLLFLLLNMSLCPTHAA
jgi:hypothetical protein